MANLPPTAALDSAAAVEWRVPLLFTLPAAALAFLIGWTLDTPSGQGTPFDLLFYPLSVALLLGLTLVLWRSPQRMNQLVTVLVMAMSTFFLCKLLLILFIMPQTYRGFCQVNRNASKLRRRRRAGTYFPWIAGHFDFDGSGVGSRSSFREHEQGDVTGKLLQILR